MRFHAPFLPRKLPTRKNAYYTDFRHLADRVYFRRAETRSFYQNIENEYIETDSIVIADDNQTAFWVLTNEGVGGISSAQVNDAVDKVSGIDSERVDTGAGASLRTTLTHIYGITQNWSGEVILVLYWKGASAGNIYYRIRDNATIWYLWRVVPLGGGVASWRRFIFLLDAPDASSGAIDWSIIKDLLIYYFLTLGETHRLDRQVIDTELLIIKNF